MSENFQWHGLQSVENSAPPPPPPPRWHESDETKKRLRIFCYFCFWIFNKCI